MPVLPLQTIPGIPELLIIAMLSAMIVGAVFLGLKLIQSLREFREGYSPEPEADLSRMDLSDADLTDTTLDETGCRC
ncbi:MAG: hypothetical protein J07HQX50_01792 [Haloquadratum sp. J07HQX50]|nr:MAG: hypothetical protein J07HQX50_01792 [Haloquadratum sp. J07HQX50]